MTQWPSVMAREIREQPSALAATLSALREARPQLESVVRDVRRVIFFARGSSDSAATYGRYLVEIVAGLPATMGAPSIATLYHVRQELAGSLVVLCSQSGRTEEITEVATWARSCGARTVAVTNDADSPLASAVDLALVTAAGVERAVPATKSHTTCLLALAELGITLADATHLRSQLAAVPDDAARVMHAATEHAAAAAHALSDAGAFAVTGRVFTLATAMELALKIEETSLVPCLGLSQADLQHGPQAILEHGLPLLVACAPKGPTIPGLLTVAQQAAEKGCPIISLGEAAELAALAATRGGWSLSGSALDEPLSPITTVIAGQLFAEALARAKGADPDAPPGLRKVTRTAS